MAITRFGFLDDFSQKNDKVGIGTSIATEKLEILGGTKSKDLKITGIATLSAYSGFIEKDLKNNSENLNILDGDSGTLSGQIIVGSGLTISVGTGATSSQGTIDAIKVYDMFMPPSGVTNQRPAGKPGALFYNFDLKTVEFYDGNNWRQVNNISRRGRGVFSGFSPGFQNRIVFTEIMTLGNTEEFGTNETGTLCAGTSDGTRGVFSGGSPAPYKDKMEYITIASTGNPIDFGDLTQNRGYAGGASSSTRGLVIGGYFNPAYTNIIDYHQIATTGNALDFGDTRLTGKAYGTAGNSIKAVFNNGNSTSDAFFDTVKISTLGNSVGFGEMTQKRTGNSGGGNAVRGIFSGGYLGGTTHKNTIDYVTFASEGNAIDFGDRTFTGSYSSSVTNSVRLVNAGSFTPSSHNYMEYVTIATTGNAIDFGDCPTGHAAGAVSDSHGGLGGF